MDFLTAYFETFTRNVPTFMKNYRINARPKLDSTDYPDELNDWIQTQVEAPPLADHSEEVTS